MKHPSKAVQVNEVCPVCGHEPVARSCKLWCPKCKRYFLTCGEV